MRFTVPTQALVDGLTWAARSLPSRPAAAVLAGVKMTVTDGRLLLSTFDYEQSAVASLALTDDAEDGAALVAGKTFNDIARSLPKGDVTVAVEDSRLRITAGRAKFALPMMPVEDYPALPAAADAVGAVPGDLLAAAVRQVVVAAGKDDSLPMLTGVEVKVDPETGVLSLAATDRYRLAIKRIEFTPADGVEAATLLVPARTLDGYAKALAGTEDVHFGGNKTSGFSVATDTRVGTSRLLDAEFVKYEALLPSEFAATAVVPTKELLEVVKRVSLVADAATPCRLIFSEGSVLVEAGNSSDDEGEGKEDVPGVAYTGEPMTIAFNFGFLIDGLNAIGADEVSINLVAPLKPAVLRPAADDADFTYLIMPVRHNG